MGLIQRFRLLTALIAPEEEEEFDVDAIPEDLDLISSMMEELRQMIPAAGEVLIDERDCYLGERIRQESTKGRRSHRCRSFIRVEEVQEETLPK